MARKIKTEKNPLFVDKLEKYIAKNYMSILVAISILIVLVFAAQFIKSYLHSKKMSIYNELSVYESKFADNGYELKDILTFIDFANKHSIVKDYVSLKSAILLSKIDNVSEAINLLSSPNKYFTELSSSLYYDLGGKISVERFEEKGLLKSIWSYRKIMSDAVIKKEEVDNFKKKYPESSLPTLLENWQE